MKTGWHLTKGINHPWPWTNYPSLPTLCPPLRGEPWNNSRTWKSAASQDRGLMDAAVRLCLLRILGWLTFKSLSFCWQHTHKRGFCLRSGSMTSQECRERRPEGWQLGYGWSEKWRPLIWKKHFLIISELSLYLIFLTSYTVFIGSALTLNLCNKLKGCWEESIFGYFMNF